MCLKHWSRYGKNTMSMKNQNKVLVIGGGPAGMMAALTAAEAGASVLLLERNEDVGRKLSITGKGRCNVTNCCSLEEALQNIPRGNRFLWSAFSRFTPQDTMDFFTALGVPLKVERGNRVFPQSDRAGDVVSALRRALERRGVTMKRGRARALLVENGAVKGAALQAGRLAADRVILATGGLSYPRLGSTGDGYRMAQAAGHEIIPPRPSLVPLEAEGCARMQGLSLKNVGLKILTSGGKTVYQDFGELLFTHFGLSGPIVLSASAHLTDCGQSGYTAILDLKPALEEKTLERRLLRELQMGANREMKTILGTLLPRLLIPVVAERAAVPLGAKGNSVTKAQRKSLLHTLKGLAFSIVGPRPIDEAIVTSGGVSLREVSPSTMESKLCQGLYFAGEILDADGYTGGFNLQIAWATGRAAGYAAGSKAAKTQK